MKSIQHWCSHSGLKLQERWGYWEVALLVLDKLHCSCSIWVHLLMCMPWFWPRLDHVAAILDMGEGVCVCASKLVFFPALQLLIWGWFREDFFSAHHIECNYCLEIEGVSWNQTGNVAACPVFFFLLVVGAGCAPPSCLDSMGGGQVAADEAQCLGRASKPAGRWEGWELQEPVAWWREALYSHLWVPALCSGGQAQSEDLPSCAWGAVGTVREPCLTPVWLQNLLWWLKLVAKLVSLLSWKGFYSGGEHSHKGPGRLCAKMWPRWIQSHLCWLLLSLLFCLYNTNWFLVIFLIQCPLPFAPVSLLIFFYLLLPKRLSSGPAFSLTGASLSVLFRVHKNEELWLLLVSWGHFSAFACCVSDCFLGLPRLLSLRVKRKECCSVFHTLNLVFCSAQYKFKWHLLRSAARGERLPNLLQVWQKNFCIPFEMCSYFQTRFPLVPFFSSWCPSVLTLFRHTLSFISTALGKGTAGVKTSKLSIPSTIKPWNACYSLAILL